MSVQALAHFDELYPLDQPNENPKLELPRALESPVELFGGYRAGTSISRSHMTLALPETSQRYGDVNEAKTGGVTYTPRELADFVADQLLEIAQLPDDRPTRILDPAIGHGELLRSLLARLDGEVEVYGFETDPKALGVATRRLTTEFPEAKLSFVEGSFLDHVIDDFGNGPLKSAESYDLIIANPPYVRTQVMGSARAQLLARQFALSGRVDLYHAFLLGMVRVLSPSGAAGMIVSNRFMTTRGGASTRRMLLAELHMKRIYDLGDTKLFNAAVLPAVIIAKGRSDITAETTEFISIYETQEDPMQRVSNPLEALAHVGISEVPDGRRFRVEHGQLDHGGEAEGVWRLGSDAVDAWLATVRSRTWGKFGDIGKIRVGVKSTADKIFLPKVWDDDLELLRPLTTHHVSRRFRAHLLTRKILYPHEVADGRKRAIPLDDFPRTRAYLERHRATLTSREYVIQAGREWYEIWVPQNPAEWQAPKLVFRDISEKPVFWMDLTGSVVNGDCYWLTGDEDLLWLALAIANSSFIERFYDHRFNNKLYGGRRRFITQYVEEFPLVDPLSSVGRTIIAKAKQVYELTPSSESDSLQSELDQMVSAIFLGETQSTQFPHSLNCKEIGGQRNLQFSV